MTTGTVYAAIQGGFSLSKIASPEGIGTGFSLTPTGLNAVDYVAQCRHRMKNLTEDRSGNGADVPWPAAETPARRCAGLRQISRARRVRYDSAMPRSLFSVMLWSTVLCAGVQPVCAIEAFAALLFAADVVTDAGAAAREAAAMTGGRVVDVQTIREGEQQVFHVKVLLDDGRVRIIQLEGEPVPSPDSNGE